MEVASVLMDQLAKRRPYMVDIQYNIAMPIVYRWKMQDSKKNDGYFANSAPRCGHVEEDCHWAV
jgi:hypothetical protein